MSGYLHIEARLPRQSGLPATGPGDAATPPEAGRDGGPTASVLELSARLLAARPGWDIELEGDGLRLAIPLIPGTVDAELTVLEEGCRQVERGRAGPTVELDVAHRAEPLPGATPPAAAGPWRIIALSEDGEPPRPETSQLILPPGRRRSRRWWAGEILLLGALAEHFSPPPGAPDTRGIPALVLEGAPPLAALAADLAGAGAVTLLADEAAAVEAAVLAEVNGRPAVEAVTRPFSDLVRRPPDWEARFTLIAIHLSPYLAARRLKTLARWLHPEGALLVSGFAPGPQTAHLLRAAARAGLALAGSVAEGDWAALRLVPRPPREALPPLSGSLVPDLLPAPEIAHPDAWATSDNETEAPVDEDSLMLDEDSAEDDES